MDTTAFPLLSEIHRRLDGRDTAPAEVRDAVALLTAVADPERAARLRPGPGEPAVLVERLAVWALRQVGPQAVAAADAVLRRPVAMPAPAASVPELVAA